MFFCLRGSSAEALRLLLRLCFLLLFAAPALASEPMLPKVYSEQTDVAGWLMSEKLDGVRGYWDGERLWSKNGHPFSPPAVFVRDLPPFPLEGEIWGGRGTFEQISGIVRHKVPHDGWLTLRFGIFDVPQAAGDFASRIEKIRSWFSRNPSGYAFVIEQQPVKTKAHLNRELQRIEALGGEGLIVRDPGALYKAGRNATILKVKSFQDAEARVVAHLPGAGRNEGRLGALLAELPGGLRFRVGSGFSDLERENPPPVGALISFKHYGQYDSGIPRFPSFLRVRQDASP